MPTRTLLRVNDLNICEGAERDLGGPLRIVDIEPNPLCVRLILEDDNLPSAACPALVVETGPDVEPPVVPIARELGDEALDLLFRHVRYEDLVSCIGLE